MVFLENFLGAMFGGLVWGAGSGGESGWRGCGRIEGEGGYLGDEAGDASEGKIVGS